MALPANEKDVIGGMQRHAKVQSDGPVLHMPMM